MSSYPVAHCTSARRFSETLDNSPTYSSRRSTISWSNWHQNNQKQQKVYSYDNSNNNNYHHHLNLSTRYNALSSYYINAPVPPIRHHSNNLQPKWHLHCPHGFDYAYSQVSRCHRHSWQRCAITLGIRISAAAAAVPRGIQKPTCFLELSRHNFYYYSTSNSLILFLVFGHGLGWSLGRAWLGSFLLYLLEGYREVLNS